MNTAPLRLSAAQAAFLRAILTGSKIPLGGGIWRCESSLRRRGLLEYVPAPTAEYPRALALVLTKAGMAALETI